MWRLDSSTSSWAARGRTTQGSTPMTSRGTACSTARRTLGASTAWTPATWTSYPRWRHRNGPTTALRTGAGATSGWRPAEHEHRRHHRFGLRSTRLGGARLVAGAAGDAAAGAVQDLPTVSRLGGPPAS